MVANSPLKMTLVWHARCLIAGMLAKLPDKSEMKFSSIVEILYISH